MGNDGHSSYDNLDGVYDDCRHLLNFIPAMRFWKGFYPEQPKNTEPDGKSQ